MQDRLVDHVAGAVPTADRLEAVDPQLRQKGAVERRVRAVERSAEAGLTGDDVATVKARLVDLARRLDRTSPAGTTAV